MSTSSSADVPHAMSSARIRSTAQAAQNAGEARRIGSKQAASRRLGECEKEVLGGCSIETICECAIDNEINKI